jgi:hypothetical protein
MRLLLPWHSIWIGILSLNPLLNHQHMIHSDTQTHAIQITMSDDRGKIPSRMEWFTSLPVRGITWSVPQKMGNSSGFEFSQFSYQTRSLRLSHCSIREAFQSFLRSLTNSKNTNFNHITKIVTMFSATLQHFEHCWQSEDCCFQARKSWIHNPNPEKTHWRLAISFAFTEGEFSS